MLDFYTILCAELRDDPITIGYASMTPQNILESILAHTRKSVVMRFGTFRTVANLLTDEEYVTFKTVLLGVAQSNMKVADVIKTLEWAGDETTGGLNFGNANVRGMINYFVANNLLSSTIATKLLAYSEILISRADELSLVPNPQLGNILTALEMNNGS